MASFNFKRDWLYLVPTILVSLMMIASAFFYLTQTPDVQAEFARLGFPTWIPIPLAIMKLLAVAAIWLSPSKLIRHFAYAGLFFNFLLAFAAHGQSGDGWLTPALGAAVFIAVAAFKDPRD
ncbi:MAG: DoxX family protein [Saprospiraceae bacterium]